MKPHQYTLELACPPDVAFEVFTTGMGGWWDPAYSPDPASYAGIALEPHVGGSVSVLVGEDHYAFGEVTAWEPGVHYAQSFWLAMDPAHPSRLTAIFALGNGGCELHFEHGGWDEANADARDRFGDWPQLLGRFRVAAESAGPTAFTPAGAVD